jgi:hypothetical protein
MKKLPLLILSLALSPGLAYAQSAFEGDGPPADSQEVQAAHPPSTEPGGQPPSPPSVPPARAETRESDDDALGILQQAPGDGVGILQQGPASAPQGSEAGWTGQWVYTNQYGWVWMPYGRQYIDEGNYGDNSPHEYVYSPGLGWSWVAAPWLWGWGVYPYFGGRGPSRFGWYRGLYRSGYGWGHYRGGGISASHGHGAGYGRGVVRASNNGARASGGGLTYGGARTHGGGFHAATRVGTGGVRAGSSFHISGVFHGGGGSGGGGRGGGGGGRGGGGGGHGGGGRR